MSEPVAHDAQGRPAVVESDDGGAVSLRLPDGARVVLPPSLIARQDDGSYLAAVSFEALSGERHTLREVEERVAVDAVVRERSRVTARTVTETHDHPVEADGWRETVGVERVPVSTPYVFSIAGLTSSASRS